MSLALAKARAKGKARARVRGEGRLTCAGVHRRLVDLDILDRLLRGCVCHDQHARRPALIDASQTKHENPHDPSVSRWLC